MFSSIEAYPPGTCVYVGAHQDIEAVVIEVSITANDRVLYKVGWWDGNVHQDEWLELSEFSLHEATPQRIGYLPAEPLP